MKYAILSLFIFSLNASAGSPGDIVTIKVKKSLTSVKSWLKQNGIRLISKVEDNNGVVRGLATMMNTTQKIAFSAHFPPSTALASTSIQMKTPPTAKSEEPTTNFGDLTMWGPIVTQGAVIQRSRPAGSNLDGSANGTKVCVIDTGIAWDHPALHKQVVAQLNANIDTCQIQSPLSLCENYDVCDDPLTSSVDENAVAFADIRTECDAFGIDLPSEDFNQLCFNSSGILKACAYDDDDHGTHVAGIIAARDIAETRRPVRGLDPSARLIAVKGLGYWWLGEGYGYLYGGFDFNIAQGIWACMDMGAQVINMSLGGQGYSEILRDAVREAAGADIIITAAAGNEGADGLSANDHFPSAFPEVLSVTALHPNGQLAEFSSRGLKTDFIAPGVSILSSTLDTQGSSYPHSINDDSTPAPCGSSSNCPKGTYMYFDGTSMAAPHVAGVASLMLSFDPWLDVSFLRGVNLGLPREHQGIYGLISAKESVEH